MGFCLSHSNSLWSCQPNWSIILFFSLESIGSILLKRRGGGREELISFFCIFLIQHLIQKSLQRFRQAHLHQDHDFHSEPTQDTEEEYYLTPRSLEACLEVSPHSLPCPAHPALLHPAPLSIHSFNICAQPLSHAAARANRLRLGGTKVKLAEAGGWLTMLAQE